jgi:predicted AlkP superfamily pyrophosphatase or phosphodiesterase
MKTKLAILLALSVGGCDDAMNNTGSDMAQMQPADMAQSAVDMTQNPGDMATASQQRRVIVFVWDGLRPDSVNATDTPNLNALKTGGVNFSDNHSTYPTFTMMNSAAFATGSFPATTGFYGNTFYAGFPNPIGVNSGGTSQDFVDPVFTEDWGILQDLDTFYGNQLLMVGTLFQAAQAAGLKTAAIGKSGAAFLQDYKKGGWIVDEKMIWPLQLAQEVQKTNAVPKTTNFAYPAGQMNITIANGDPTALNAKVTLAATTADPAKLPDPSKGASDPTDATGSPVAAANFYMMDVYLRYVLPKMPDVSLIWFRAPDSPEHNYGPGSPNYKAAVRHQDFLLGQLQAQLKTLGVDKSTDIIIVSDHGHSNVSGPVSLFPLRTVASGLVTTVDNAAGWSVSGDVRMADLLTRAGFTNVYDGQGCLYESVMSGLTGSGATGTQIYPDQTDVAGTICNKGANFKYTTANFLVPKGALAPKSIVIATNGGSDYIYVPDHDPTTVTNLIAFLQSREEVGAIFVHSRYNTAGAPPAGTLSLAGVKLENTARGANAVPDVVYSYTWDDQQQIAGLPGIEFESMSGASNRGMHGSFSPIDVHNTLIASGPDFKASFTDTLPSGNVDVAPTVAKLFGLSLPQADGRSLDEALAQNGAALTDYNSASSVVNPAAAATGLTFKLPTDPSSPGTNDSALTVGSYSIDLHIKTLTKGTKSWTYFDSAKAVRQ